VVAGEVIVKAAVRVLVVAAVAVTGTVDVVTMQEQPAEIRELAIVLRSGGQFDGLGGLTAGNGKAAFYYNCPFDLLNRLLEILCPAVFALGIIIESESACCSGYSIRSNLVSKMERVGIVRCSSSSCKTKDQRLKSETRTL